MRKSSSPGALHAPPARGEQSFSYNLKHFPVPFADKFVAGADLKDDFVRLPVSNVATKLQVSIISDSAPAYG